MAPSKKTKLIEEQLPLATSSTLSPSAYASALSRVAVSEICLSTGYSAAEPSALRALSDIAGRYLEALGRCASSIAAAHGRTDSNVLDIVRAIEELSAGRGFVGAADPTRPPLLSLALRDIMAFVESVDEIPFPKPIRRERQQKGEHWRSFASSGQEPPLRHVPRWLPCFPEELAAREGKVISMKAAVEDEEERATIAAAGDYWGGEGNKSVESPTRRRGVGEGRMMAAEAKSIREGEGNKLMKLFPMKRGRVGEERTMADGDTGSEGNKGVELPAKRERIRFRMQVAKKGANPNYGEI